MSQPAPAPATTYPPELIDAAFDELEHAYEDGDREQGGEQGLHPRQRPLAGGVAPGAVGDGDTLVRWGGSFGPRANVAYKIVALGLASSRPVGSPFAPRSKRAAPPQTLPPGRRPAPGRA